MARMTPRKRVAMTAVAILMAVAAIAVVPLIVATAFYLAPLIERYITGFF